MKIKSSLNNEDLIAANGDTRYEILATEGQTVFLIDDDSWFHRIVAKYVMSWGFSCKSFLDPVDAIASAILEQPAIIFLDLVLPEVKGTTVLRLLKKIRSTENIPIVIISNNMDVDTLVDSYQLGAAGYISKPISKEILFYKIKEIFKSTDR